MDFRIEPRYYRVEQRGYETPCWIWHGAKLKGYGQVWHPGLRKRVQAHRHMFEQTYGPIPPGLLPDHLCRNRDCVRPDHLELVSNAENVRRALRVSDAQVEMVRVLGAQGISRRLIAKAAHVSYPVAAAILDSTYWR